MDKNTFAELFKQCIEEGIIDFEYKEGDTIYGETSSDTLEIKVNNQTVNTIYMRRF